MSGQALMYGSGSVFISEVTLQYGLLLTLLCGTQQGLRQQRPYRPSHWTDKGRTKVTRLLYTWEFWFSGGFKRSRSLGFSMSTIVICYCGSWFWGWLRINMNLFDLMVLSLLQWVKTIWSEVWWGLQKILNRIITLAGLERTFIQKTAH